MKSLLTSLNEWVTRYVDNSNSKGILLISFLTIGFIPFDNWLLSIKLLLSGPPPPGPGPRPPTKEEGRSIPLPPPPPEEDIWIERDIVENEENLSSEQFIWKKGLNILTSLIWRLLAPEVPTTLISLSAKFLKQKEEKRETKLGTPRKEKAGLHFYHFDSWFHWKRKCPIFYTERINF